MSFSIKNSLKNDSNIPMFNASKIHSFNVSSNTPLDSQILQWSDITKKWEIFTFILEDEHETAFSGLGATSTSVSIKIQKVGNTVSLRIPKFTLNAESTGYIIESTVALPLAYRPADKLVVQTVIDNIETEIAYWTLESNGILTLNGFGAFPFNEGTTGLFADSNLTYQVPAS